MARLRLGVALLFDEPVRTELVGLRRALGSPSIGTQPPHLTLVPPVNVREGDVGAALAVLRAAAATAARPLRLEIGPAATFQPVSPVAYLAVGGDVAELAALRDGVLSGPLQRRIDFPFVPHVTLREDVTDGDAAHAVAALRAYRAEVTVRAVTLLREGPGRVWAPIADARLEEPVLRGRGGVEVGFRGASVVAPDVRALLAAAGATVPGRPGTELAGAPWVLEAWEGSALAGAAVGVAGRGQWVITSLGIAAAHRGRGIGTRLLDEVVTEAAAAGASTVGVLFPVDAPEVPEWVARRGFVSRHPRAGRARWLALPRG